MRIPPNRGSSPARLNLESLEDRAVPATVVAPAAYYDTSKVLVTFTSSAAEVTGTPALSRSPLTAGVSPAGLGVYRVYLRPGVTVSDAMYTFSRIGGVSVAQPDYRLQSSALPNDPSAGNQWQFRAPSSGVGGSNAVQGWNAATGTGQTIVAVIDSGIDRTHPDLMYRMWNNPREVPGNGVDDDGNGFTDDMHGADFADNDADPMDDFGHGTHVAGIIGAAGNNGTGVSGMSWNTRIMSLKFMRNDGGGYTSDAVRAVDYAINNGARIINASWGGRTVQRGVAIGVVAGTFGRSDLRGGRRKLRGQHG